MAFSFLEELSYNTALPGAYSKYNIRGAELCHAVGCRKHKRLHTVFRGRFCIKHQKIIASIRENVHSPDMHKQLEARYQEMLLRKWFDEAHINRILILERIAMYNIFYQPINVSS